MSDLDDTAASDAIEALARQRRVVDRMVRDKLQPDAILANFLDGDRWRARDILAFVNLPESRVRYCVRQLKALVRRGLLVEHVNTMRRSQPQYSLPPPAAAPAESSLCVACREKARTVLLLPCRHLCLCAACSGRVAERCPICRGGIEERVDVLMP